eukprot:scaffold8742_cov56-Attheya_sp.AAC.4
MKRELASWSSQIDWVNIIAIVESSISLMLCNKDGVSRHSTGRANLIILYTVRLSLDCMVVLDLSRSKIMTCGLEAMESNPNTHVHEWKQGRSSGASFTTNPVSHS